MASISRTAEGKFLVRWRDGKKQRKQRFSRMADAKRHMHKIQSDLDAGKYLDPNAGRESFAAYAGRWLSAQTFNASTAQAVELRLRLHAFPLLGEMRMATVKPSTIQGWLRSLDNLAPSYRRTIFTNVSTVFASAVDDEVIVKNPCSARSVTKPRIDTKKVIPWPAERVAAVRDALPARYAIVATLAAGLGLRQGEVFGLAPADVDFLRGTVEVQRQVKVFAGNRPVLAPPKNRRARTVPLPASVRDELAAYLAAFPARTVALPWETPDGEVRAVALILTTREAKPLNRNYFNGHIWKPALVAAGVLPTRDNGCHALRHFYASVLLDAGVSIRVVSEYLGHADPGFTLRTYTHLMPPSSASAGAAVDAALDRVRPMRAHGAPGTGGIGS